MAAPTMATTTIQKAANEAYSASVTPSIAFLLSRRSTCRQPWQEQGLSRAAKLVVCGDNLGYLCAVNSYNSWLTHLALGAAVNRL